MITATDRSELHELAKRALDCAVALTPPVYGMDRGVYRARLGEIEELLGPLRRRRSLTKNSPLPGRAELRQLADLSGRDFVAQRESIARRLQKFCLHLEAGERAAPADLKRALHAVAAEQTEGGALCRDADEAWRSFHSGAYKAAVVMAGSTLEGMLQQALIQLGPKAERAFMRLYDPRRKAKRPESFSVDDGLAVLKELGIVSSAIAHVARGMKELRNFVHPGVQRRQRSRVTSAHALLVLQALCTLAEEIRHGLSRRD